MDELISIIIPVYNVSLYLKNCLSTICSQTYSNYELILVDDGSTDNSLAVCKDFQKKNNNTFVYHIENHGPSYARNYGVKKARGKYVTFIDSDDYVSDEYLNCLYTMIKDTSAEIAIVGLLKVDSYGKCPRKLGNYKIFSKDDAVRCLLYQKYIDTSPCAMLVKKAIVERNPFPEGRYHEDDFTTYKYLLEANNVAIMFDKHYFYLQREGSIMHSSGVIDLDELAAADNLENVFKTIDNGKFARAAKSKKFSDYCQVLLKNPNIKNLDYDSYKKIITYLKNERYNILTDKNTRLKNKLAALLLYFGVDCLFIANKIKS